MTFNQEHFDALIEKLVPKLENFARQQPRAYRWRVGLLATLGYAYIFFILAITLALSLGIIWLMLYSRTINAQAAQGVFFLLAFALVLLRSLWVSFPPPQGLVLKHKEVKRLFLLVEELSKKLKAPQFHHILLTDDFNAAVVQRPKFGLFGWHENYIIIGLPLMLALSPEQFRAVLAHELGHLSGNHSRFAGWIYRQRVTWYQIFENLQKSRNELTWFIFVRFFRWYVPFFNAYSFVLARMDEYEADRCAAKLTGAENTAQMLVNVEVKGRFLEHYFWSSVYKQVETEIEPPKTTYTQMSIVLGDTIPSEEAHRFLTEAWRRKTNNNDTHPCLVDRVAALKSLFVFSEEVSSVTSIKVSAANLYLGVHFHKIIDYFNHAWSSHMETPWRQRYVYVQECLSNLKKLELKSEKYHLTAGEAWSRANLTFELQGEEAAIPLLHEVINIDEHHVAANFLLGEIFLKKQDATGIEYFEKAMKKDPSFTIQACQIIYFFLEQQGQIELAKSYLQRAEQHYDIAMKSHKDIFYSRDNKYLTHNLWNEISSNWRTSSLVAGRHN